MPVFCSLFDDLGIRYRWTLRTWRRRASEAWAAMTNALARRTKQDKYADGTPGD